MIELNREKYNKEIAPKMMEEFGYNNVMAVPRLLKVVVNTGIGKLAMGKTPTETQKFAEPIAEDLSAICGQKAVLTKAKRSIAGFKLRAGMTNGVKVTLRGRKMNDFLERLINVALPRSRDFAGISDSAFDDSGNLTIGIKEQVIFPEISAEKTKIVFGFEITVVTTAKNKEESVKLFRLLKFPIK